MKSNMMSKSRTGEVLREVAADWRGATEFPRVKNLMAHMLEDGSQIITGNNIRIAKVRDGTYVPLLTETSALASFPHVVVDMGAVRFVCKGANLMRPGITKFGEFGQGEIVCVRDESQGKYLAVGMSVMSSESAAAADRGEVLKNLHYISDRLWEAAKEIP